MKSFHRFLPVLILSLVFTTHFLVAQPPEVTDTEKVKELLDSEIEDLEKAIESQGKDQFVQLKRLQDIGDWAFVERQIQANGKLSQFEKQILKARQAWLENDFFEMEEILKSLPDTDRKSQEVQRLHAVLHIEAWELEKAINPKNVDRQAALYQKAYTLETDDMEKAENGRVLRNFYHRRALLSEALQSADEYVKNASKVSTYLRDAMEEAQAFIAWQRGKLGDQKQVEILTNLVAQRPHDYGMRLQYADVLIALDEGEKALNTLLPSYQNLRTSKVNRPDFELRIAQAYHLLDDQEKAMEYLHKIQLERLNKMDRLALLQLQMELDKMVNFTKKFGEINGGGLALYESELAYTRALLALQRGNNTKVLLELENALRLNPFHVKALKSLKTLAKTDKKARKFLQKEVVKKAEQKINSLL